jgi:hypothetical protein
LAWKQLSAEQTDLEVKPLSAFLDLAQICILASVASFGLSQCRISRAKAFHQFILIVLG